MALYKNVGGVKIEMTPEEITEENNRLASQMREQRNKLLAETDFYGLSDVTMSDDMKTYRQALRDIPETQPEPKLDYTNGDLINVTWPTKPE